VGALLTCLGSVVAVVEVVVVPVAFWGVIERIEQLGSRGRPQFVELVVGIAIRIAVGEPYVYGSSELGVCLDTYLDGLCGCRVSSAICPLFVTGVYCVN
jgi:hypothetical protein